MEAAILFIDNLNLHVEMNILSCTERSGAYFNRYQCTEMSDSRPTMSITKSVKHQHLLFTEKLEAAPIFMNTES